MWDMLSLVKNNALHENILIGLIGGLVLKTVSYGYHFIEDKIFAIRNVSVAGVWTAEFISHIENRNNIEILLIEQHIQQIKVSIHQFSSNSQRVQRFKGLGVMRGISISSIYYTSDQSSLQHGVLALRLGSTASGDLVLRGRYAELEIGGGETRIVSSEEKYVLTKLSVSVLQKLLFRFGYPIVKSYDDARKLVAVHRTEVVTQGSPQ